ncbi:MAG TPA: hypothetical protein VFS55_13360 [Dokdonella sp.]|nr:hypothetical protein [Dokdonella sp.]
MRRLIEALAANYGYSAFAALVTLLVVPLYVRLLDGAWGQLALCLTLQGFLLLADGALSPLLLRDAARSRDSRASLEYWRFLRWYAAIAIAVVVAGQAALVLARGTIDPGLSVALRLALVQYGFQFANGAAIAFLIGRGCQREANLRLVAFTATKHAAALSLLVREPTAVAYLAAFATVSAIEFGVNHLRVRGDAGRSRDGSAAVASEGAPRVAAFVGASALGLVGGQLDRVVLALTQPASRYGVYYLAGSVMLSLLSLQVPALRTFLPLAAAGRRPRSTAASMLAVLAATIVAPALAIALFAERVLSVWLHDTAIAAEGAPVLRLLMLALVMNALYAPAGMLLVHAHRYSTLAVMNAAIVAGECAVLYWLVPDMGILAGAIAWIAGGAIQLVVAVGVWRGGIADDPGTRNARQEPL